MKRYKIIHKTVVLNVFYSIGLSFTFFLFYLLFEFNYDNVLFFFDFGTV